MKLHLPSRLRASLLTATLVIPALSFTPAFGEIFIYWDRTGGDLKYNCNVTLQDGAVFKDLEYIDISAGSSEAGDLTLIGGATIDGVLAGSLALPSIQVDGNFRVGDSDGGGGVIRGVKTSMRVGGDLAVTGAGSQISDVGWEMSISSSLEVRDGGEISDVRWLYALSDMKVNRGTLTNVACKQDEQDIVGMVNGTLEISNGSSITTTSLQVAGAISVSDSVLDSATLTSTGGDIRLGAVSGSGSILQTLCGDPMQGSHNVILTGDVTGEHTIISAADLQIQNEQGVCVSGSLIQVAGKVTGTALQLKGGSLMTVGTELDTLELSQGASYTDTGTMQTSVLSVGSTAQAAITHLSTGTLRYTFLQTGSAPLTLGSYSSSAAGNTISIDLTAQALVSGEGTYTLLSLSGAGAESLDASNFTLSSATLTLLGEEGAADLLLSTDGQTLLVTLSGQMPIPPDEPITPEPPAAGFYESSVGSAASANGRAGLRLADQATVAQTVAPGSDMDLLLTALDEAIGAGNMRAADGIAAQLSGVSATTLGLAFAADAQRHLNSIRNRLTTMNVDTIGAPDADPVTGPVPAKSKFLSTWVNAEGSYQTMEQSVSAPAYSMSSWGGTLGIEYAVLQNLRCGLALTALYGDLDADARAVASGDLDTCYISAFGQYRQSAWTHTLVASLGLSDISFDRTVSHSMGSYRTSGETDSVSLGLGGRIQSLTGENIFNRSTLIEGRVLAKFNCGDRHSAASVGFANGIGLAGVESAEIGVFGVELGAGLTVPLGGEAGSIFVDASYELYSEYSNLNASVGYRLSF